MHARNLLSWVALCLAAAACGEDPATPIGPPATVEVVSGDGQEGTVGDDLASPVTVRVRDAAGAAVPGIRVFFEPDAPSGSADPSSAETDAAGAASTVWTLGTTAGAQGLVARLGAGTPSVDVTATAVPGAPAQVAIEAGEGQTGTRSTELSDPIVVGVQDEYGNPTPGVGVTFEVSDGGSITPTTADTDLDGRASAAWTLGAGLGTQTLTATIGAALSASTTAEATVELTVLDHLAIDAVLDPSGGRILTVSADPPRLSSVDVATGGVTSLDLVTNPTSLSVQPDGAYAAIGHDGFISYVNLGSFTVEQVYAVTCDVIDLELPGNGWVYAFPRTDQWETIRSIDLSTGAETTTGTIRAGTLVKLHPSGDYIYGADNGLSPSDIEKYEISGGAAVYLYDSPYHGDHSFGGNLWMYEDGSRIIARSGRVFRSSSVQADDMLYAGSLANSGTLNSAAQSTALGRVVLVGSEPIAGGVGTAELRSYTDSFFAYQGSVRLPPFTEIDGGTVTTFTPEGRFAFVSPDGASVYVLLRGGAPYEGRFNTGLAVFEAADIP